MADSVNAPLLAVLPAKTSSVKIPNVADSASKSANSTHGGEDGAFSRVLDRQTSDRSGGGSATAREPSDAGQGGNALPGQRTETAAGSNDGEGQATSDGTGQASAGDTSTATATSGGTGGPGKAAETVPETPPGDSGVVFADLTAAEAAELVAADTTGSKPPTAHAGSVLAAQDQEWALAAGQTPGAGRTAETERALGAEQALGAERNLTSQQALSSERALSGAPGQAASARPGTAAVGASGAETGTAYGSFSASGLASLNSTDPLQPSAAERAALRPGAAVSQAATDFALQSSSQVDGGAQTRSRGDWLQFAMGSEARGQFAAGDAGGEEFAEMMRAPTLQARADAPLSNGPAVAATLAPNAAGAAGSATAASAALPAAGDLALMHAPQEPEFAGELTARMKTLVREGVREARLQLHPAELGRLQVTVSTEGDQARVSFVAETPAAREAIEQSLPRLREMLEQSGMQLAQSDVGQRDLQDGRDGQGDGSSSQGLAADSAESGTDAEPIDAMPYGTQRVTARIDTYI